MFRSLLSHVALSFESQQLLFFLGQENQKDNDLDVMSQCYVIIPGDYSAEHCIHYVLKQFDSFLFSHNSLMSEVYITKKAIHVLPTLLACNNKNRCTCSSIDGDIYTTNSKMDQTMFYDFKSVELTSNCC